MTDQPKSPLTSGKSKGFAIFLAIVLGWLGIDEMYLGRMPRGAFIAGAYLISSFLLMNLAETSLLAANLVGIVQIAFVLFGWWRAYELFAAPTVKAAESDPAPKENRDA